MTINWGSALDPVSLQKLAEYMRDETWLDMRVCDHGPVERVQVMNITVWPDREDVTMRQEVSRTDDGTIVELQLEVDAEDIMWARPSAFTDPLDVKEALVDEREIPKYDGTLDAAYLAVVQAIADEYQMTLLALQTELTKTYSLIGPATDRRHLLVWVLYGMLGEKVSVKAICEKVGYKSPMPFHSARVKFELDAGKWQAVIQRIRAKAESIL